MKKVISICLCLVLMSSLLIGCGQSEDPDTDTVYVKKNGSITEISIGDFDKDYYDQEELQQFIEDEITSYKEENEDCDVKMDSVSVEEGVAKLSMNYGDYSDYAGFNGVEFFAGTVVQAIAAGYTFDVAYNSVEAGTEAGSADQTEVTGDDKFKVVVLNEDTDVVVKGKIAYVSGDNVTVKSDNTASVAAMNEGVSYIIYK